MENHLNNDSQLIWTIYKLIPQLSFYYNITAFFICTLCTNNMNHLQMSNVTTFSQYHKCLSITPTTHEFLKFNNCLSEIWFLYHRLTIFYLLNNSVQITRKTLEKSLFINCTITEQKHNKKNCSQLHVSYIWITILHSYN